jgi:hypothetical protein
MTLDLRLWITLLLHNNYNMSVKGQPRVGSGLHARHEGVVGAGELPLPLLRHLRSRRSRGMLGCEGTLMSFYI